MVSLSNQDLPFEKSRLGEAHKAISNIADMNEK